MKRPWRSRVWFYKPQLPLFVLNILDDYEWKQPTLRERLWSLVPLARAGDEFNWHTVVIGWNITGQIVIATRGCTGKGRCAEELADEDIPDHFVLASPWPVDAFGHNHVECDNPECYCVEDAAA